METELLYKLLLPFENEEVSARLKENPLSKTDFYIDGLTGAQNSSDKRDSLAEAIGLPAGMTADALLAAIKILFSYDEYLTLVGRSESQN